MKFQVWILIAAVIGGAHSRLQWRGYGSTTPDYDTESTTFTNDEEEFETVGSCTETKLNVEVEEIDYAWCIEDLAKYIRGVTVDRFLASEIKLQNTMEFDHPMLPGTWGFVLKTVNCTEMGNHMEVTIYYNTTDPDIVINPELLLKGQKRAIRPCTRESSTIKRIENVPYNYDNQDYYTFIRTTRPPLRTFYSYQTKFRFSSFALYEFVFHNSGYGQSIPVESTQNHLDLIFKITAAKKGTVVQSTLKTSCDEPTYRVLQKKLMREEFATGMSVSSFPPRNNSDSAIAGGGGANSAGVSWNSNGGFSDNLVPNRYSYSTPKYQSARY
ncbi:unnamed protein product [Allacma fusca]|uniref:Uncharacterized protein n=1 Tax=Allacma fusca TaxID=39272 RepID=A0A8J2KEL8_9HEXA|nr:unnamed protein product [Allacma fusca]